MFSRRLRRTSDVSAALRVVSVSLRIPRLPGDRLDALDGRDVELAGRLQLVLLLERPDHLLGGRADLLRLELAPIDRRLELRDPRGVDELAMQAPDLCLRRETHLQSLVGEPIEDRLAHQPVDGESVPLLEVADGVAAAASQAARLALGRRNLRAYLDEHVVGASRAGLARRHRHVLELLVEQRERVRGDVPVGLETRALL
jgi:hypothetical protein